MKLRSLLAIAVCAMLAAGVACSESGGEPADNGANGGSDNNGGGSAGDQPYQGVLVAQPDAWDGVKRSDLTYQILIYSFADSNGDGIGDLKGITSKLDYIGQLGATAIWLSPIHPADSYHGYDVTDYTAINPQYGTMADFEELVREAHHRGIRIYLDYVLNHTGKSHPWFVGARSSLSNPYRDYYIFSSDPEADLRNNRLPMFSDHAYNAGEWFDATLGEAASRRCKFTLQWGSTPTVTVTESDRVDAPNPDTSTEGAKYLYFGDGTCQKFYDKGNSTYELNVDFESGWGFLVRTSNTTWDNGTKYGAAASAGRLSLGRPFTLTNQNPGNIVPDWIELWKCHSNFYTDYMPDLNYGPIASFRESGPYRELVAAAKGWIDRGVDGFRLDAVKHIYHNSTSEENPTFLAGFYTDLNDYYRASHDHDLYMVGEMYSGAQEVAPYYRGLPALFEFDFWYRVEWAVNESTGCYLTKDLLSYRQLYAGYRADFIAATKLGNHDEDRTRSKLGSSLSRAKMAGAILLTAGGQPYVYYGEELGFVGTKQRGDEYVRGPMKWGDGFNTTFIDRVDAGMSSVPDTERQAGDPGSILNLYRQFGQLRNIYPAMSRGTMVRHGVYNDSNTAFRQIAAWYREYEGERMLVIHNLSNRECDLELADRIDKCVAVTERVELDGRMNTLRMGAYASVVFKLKR